MSAGRTRPKHHARPHGHLTTWTKARKIARDTGVAMPARTRKLPEALGHTLAEPLTALTDLPAFDTSAMDGWAVAGPGPWTIHESTTLAGQEPARLPDGAAVGIATGAQLPAGASAVLRYEHGHVEGSTALLWELGTASSPTPGRDVRPRGQECSRGEPLLPAGSTVTPGVLGLAAAAGYDHLAVHQRPTVELLVLGDELLDTGLPHQGRVRDALSPMLEPWLRCATEVITRRLVSDDRDSLLNAVRHSPADVVITTGSTAAGPVDHLHAVLAEINARLLVDSVAVRPGHPMLLAELPNSADGRARRLVGLPGNPLAAVAGIVTLAMPLLERLSGRPAIDFHQVRGTTELPWHSDNTRLVPVRLHNNTALPLPFHGPAMLRGLAAADGLAVVPPGGVLASATAEFLPMPRPW
ncbi:molybdopterin molybdotransferase MoeA [Saccharopolyspora mangrovi]|uniref:Molybdopterin molybdenumtransferase n=1 Tax=Saccharopolyspora mangrovi TaxID=3082379 RepID=A0ABU6A523_9PSEU|nr:molybdopterin molybdotransferase MoeA [Saccharopolyspora sp. S2-29]MEB3366641.1 molybdopterin molybdotransferase MoeA [Saccharopolyspora sp. S2-29]